MEQDTEIDDATIILQLMERDEGALRNLLAKHGPQVKGNLMKKMGNIFDEQEIMEILHEAALRVWLHADKLDDSKGTLGAWYYGIARNFARDLLRERKKKAVQDKEVIDHLKAEFPVVRQAGRRTHVEPTATSPMASGENTDDPPPPKEVAALRAAIAGLPTNQRAIIEADLIALGVDSSVASSLVLARQLNSTQNSVCVSRKKALESLRKALSDLNASRKESPRQ